MLGEDRAYAGGLHKVEPKELDNVTAVIAALLPTSAWPQEQKEYTSAKSLLLRCYGKEGSS